MGEKRVIFTVSLRKPEGKRPLGRPRQRWEGTIKNDLKKYEGKHGLDSFGSGQEQMAGFCEHYNEPLGALKMHGIP
jgi:hypothetical protein